MTLEQRYGLVLTAMAAGSVALLWRVVHTYSWEVTTLLMQRCPASLAVMVGSGFHFGSVCVLAASLGLSVFVCLRLLFSCIKTISRLSHLQQTARPLPRRLVHLCEQLQISPSNLVYVSHPLVMAVTLGVWRPRIVLSTTLVREFSDGEILAIISHEKYHASHAHPLYILLGEVLASSVPFFPVVADVVATMKHDFEVAADAAVVEVGNLLGLQRALARVQTTLSTQAVGLGFAHTGLLHRQERLQGSRRWFPQLKTLNVVVSLLVVAALCVLTLLPHPVQAVVVKSFGSGPFSSAVRYECAEVMSSVPVSMSVNH